jgi:hypothetical protein
LTSLCVTGSACSIPLQLKAHVPGSSLRGLCRTRGEPFAASSLLSVSLPEVSDTRQPEAPR